MKRFLLSLCSICCLLFAFFMSSCGNGPGSPGSSGSENTGINIQSVSIQPNSTDGDSGPDIDTNIHTCPDGTSEPGLFRVSATMAIASEKLNPTSDPTGFDPFPASVEECTIVYKQPADELGAPVIEAWTVYPNCTIIEGDNSCVVNLIDIQRKVDYWDNVISVINDPQKYPTRYVASYDCKYVNNVGESGHFKVELEIFLADFDNCP